MIDDGTICVMSDVTLSFCVVMYWHDALGGRWTDLLERNVWERLMAEC